MVAGELDLDALLAETRLDPVPVKLKGRTYHVRCDLRADEINTYWELLRANDPEQDAEALTILVGEDGSGLNKALEALPNEHRKLATQKIMLAAKLVVDTDLEGGTGESEAS